MINPKYLIYHDLIGIKAYAKLKSKKNNTEFLDIGDVIDDVLRFHVAEEIDVMPEGTWIQDEHRIGWALRRGCIGSSSYDGDGAHHQRQPSPGREHPWASVCRLPCHGVSALDILTTSLSYRSGIQTVISEGPRLSQV